MGVARGVGLPPGVGGVRLTLSMISDPTLRSTPGQSLFGSYAGDPDLYDEIYAEPGVLRTHWQAFAQATSKFGVQDFSRRWAQARRLLQENSLAYPDPRNRDVQSRPWDLDPLPLILNAEEWRSLSDALQQRATLLNLVLQDLFGPQRLLQGGDLPASLVYRHLGFRLPLASPATPPAQMLHFYAADLARAPDGKWWVMGDRSEAPSGTGYALENRIALSRMMPTVPRQCQIMRLAPFFKSVQDRLAELAAPHGENAQTVMLSPRAGSPHYFEAAYLARYLGYPVAESGDLAVRDNQVYLKTLGGLSPVNVLMRRLNTDECDPLELPGQAAGGVAGLLQAAQSGSVTIANSLGSGLIESPAFMAFMPKLCQRLLGEPLKMPGVATWWCGDPDAKRYVLEHLDDLTIKPAYRRRSRERDDTKELRQLTPEQIAKRIERTPERFVAQERVVRSIAPVWNETATETGYIALRSFAVASGDSYQVMPGGLARVSKSHSPLELSVLEGERSKDTWVISDGPVPSVSLLNPAQADIALSRAGADLPSRVAESLFWLGRQVERAESQARLVRTVTLRLTSDEEADRLPELPPLVRALAELGQIEPDFVLDIMKPQLPAIENQLPLAVFDDTQMGTLRSLVSGLTMQALGVRDRMSIDCWRVIRQMNERFVADPATADLADVLEKIDALMVNLSAVSGLVVESMTRTQGWRFLKLGQRIERAVQTATLIHAMVECPGMNEHAPLEALLEVADSLMTYRSRYLSRMKLGPVLDLLITDESNPRSIAFQIVDCENLVAELPQDQSLRGTPIEQQLTHTLLNRVRRTDSQHLARNYEAGASGPLLLLLSDVSKMLPKLSDAISHKYLIHSGDVQRLTELDTESDTDE